MRSARYALIASAVCATLAAGAAPAGALPARATATAAGTTLIVGSTGSPPNLDCATGVQNGGDDDGALDNLVTFNPAGKVEPWLAESVSTPDNTTYIFHLRPNVQFWDGSVMTSADVVNALDYYKRPGCQLDFLYKSVQSIAADGPDAVVVKLTQPDATFLPGLAYASPIFEKSFYELHKATMGEPNALPVGTGPFEIDSFDPTRDIQMSANPHWWGGAVPYQHVTIDFFTTETSEALAMRAGEIDVAFPQSGNSYAATSGAKVYSAPANAESYFVMNPHIAPFNNIYVRRAVAYAINRTALIQAIGNAAEPVSTLIPANELETIATPAQVNALLSTVPTYPYDLAKAKAELAESPYPHGFTTSTVTLEFGFYTPVCEVIAADLKKIGITMNIKEMTFDQWLAYYIGPKTYPNLYVNDNEIYPDPSAHPDGILGSWNIAAGHANMSGWSTPQLDSLINEGDSTLNPVKRLPIYGQIMRLVADEVPYVPLFVPEYNVAVGRNYAITDQFAIAYNYSQPFELYVKQL